MSIENLLAELIAAVRENTEALRAQPVHSGLTVTTIEPKKEANAVATNRNAKAEKPAEPKTEAKVEETKPVESSLDYTTDVKPLVIQYASKHGKPKLMDLLATFGTDSALKFAQECTAQELVNLHKALSEGLA
jgi:electron transfer flavoprotein alpha subunit